MQYLPLANVSLHFDKGLATKYNWKVAVAIIYSFDNSISPKLG